MKGKNYKHEELLSYLARSRIERDLYNCTCTNIKHELYR